MMRGMKLIVRLPEGDVRFLDSFAVEHGMRSRSAVLHHAIGLLRTADLESAYEAAFDEWATDDAAAAWDVTSRTDWRRSTEID